MDAKDGPRRVLTKIEQMHLKLKH